jgi:hypothetical protein
MIFNEHLLEVGCKLLPKVFPSIFSKTFKSEITVVLSLRAGWTIRNSTGMELQIIMTLTILTWLKLRRHYVEYDI